MERGNARTDRPDQHQGLQHPNDGPTATEDRCVGTYGADHAGVGQCPLSTKRCSAGVGDAIGNHAVVPAAVLAQPELDRTAVEVHQTSRAVRALPSGLRRVSGCHQRGHRRTFNHPRRKPGVADDAEIPAVRRCLTYGRVKYNYWTLANNHEINKASPAISALAARTTNLGCVM